MARVYIEPYNKVFDETLALWKTYATEYREIVPEYKRLLAEKRRKSISPLSPIKRTDLEDFPTISLFKIGDEDEALEFMLNLQESTLRYVRRQILSYVGSKLRADLIAKISDYRCQIRRHDAPNSGFIAPESCGSGKHTRNYGNAYGSRDEFTL